MNLSTESTLEIYPKILCHVLTHSQARMIITLARSSGLRDDGKEINVGLQDPASRFGMICASNVNPTANLGGAQSVWSILMTFPPGQLYFIEADYKELARTLSSNESLD